MLYPKLISVSPGSLSLYLPASCFPSSLTLWITLPCLQPGSADSALAVLTRSAAAAPGFVLCLSRVSLGHAESLRSAVAFKFLSPGHFHSFVEGEGFCLVMLGSGCLLSKADDSGPSALHLILLLLSGRWPPICSPVFAET